MQEPSVPAIEGPNREQPLEANSREAIPLPAPDAADNNNAAPNFPPPPPQQQHEQPPARPVLMITTSEQNHKLLASPPSRQAATTAAAGGLSVAIAGATGAVGRELVRMLVDDPNFVRVVALSRTAIERLEWPTHFPGINVALAKDKLVICPVDWEAVAKVVMPQRKRELRDESISSEDDDDDIIPRIAASHKPSEGSIVEGAYNALLLTGITHAANCMGTTFASAKSVSKLRRVDHDYAIVFMELLRRHSGADNIHFTQISYSGASKNSFLPYQRIKGKTDEVVRQANFNKFTIIKPGMLGRKEKRRFSERLLEYFLVSKIPVDTVASGIIAEWRGLYNAPAEVDHKFHNKQIHESAGHYETRRSHEIAHIQTPKLPRGDIPSTPASPLPQVPPNTPVQGVDEHHGHHLKHLGHHVPLPHLHHHRHHHGDEDPNGSTKELQQHPPQPRFDATGVTTGTEPVHHG
jgi:uncharacterized protein YbjT (DUF2867 family)